MKIDRALKPGVPGNVFLKNHEDLPSNNNVECYFFSTFMVSTVDLNRNNNNNKKNTISKH